MKTPLLILIVITSLLHAQEQSALNMQHVRTAASWLSGSDAAKRKAAISTFRTMPAEAMPHYKTALEAALKINEQRIKDADKGINPLTEHDDIARQLTDERKRVMVLIRTDYEKNNSKIQMLRNEMKGLISLYQKREKLSRGNIDDLTTTVNSSLDALCEITRELQKLDPKDSPKLDDAELRAQLIDASYEATHVLKMLATLEATKVENTQLAEVEKHNADHGTWCNGSMKSFATIINFERAVIGLPALRIEEKLSDAAAGHSSDMASGGFFAHESPVPNKKSPSDRAKLAQFKGGMRGENIFMGSASPQAAYDAWFGSDGHRFIMFGDGPNCCGIGISGIHWTLMTGRN